jgi:hypothetical protein
MEVEMPVWAWVLLIAFLGALVVAAILLIVRATHRMRSQEPLHGDPTKVAATVPMHVHEADYMTSRELEAERGPADEDDRMHGTPTPGRPSAGDPGGA